MADELKKITYEDKVDYQVQGQDEKYRISAKDMNEIKHTFNASTQAIQNALNQVSEAYNYLGDYKVENGLFYFKKADGTWGEGINLNVSAEEFENVVRRVTSLETNGVAVGDTLPIGSIVYIEGDEKDLPTGYKKVDMHPPKQILINNDFQINQRGKTLYNDFGYTLDMWYFYGVAGNGTTKPKIEVKDQGIKITNTDYAWVSIQQVVPDSLRGKTVTICFKAKDLQSNQLASINYPMNVRMCYADTAGGITSDNSYGIKSITEDGMYSITIDIPKNTTHDKLKLAFMIGGSATIEYIDLFEGDVDYPHVREDNAIALMKCQRKFLAFNNVSVGIGNVYNDIVYATIFIPTSLDRVPTISFSGYKFIVDGLETANIKDIHFVSMSANLIYVRITLQKSFTTANGLSGRITSQGIGNEFMYFSCEPA